MNKNRTEHSTDNNQEKNNYISLHYELMSDNAMKFQYYKPEI